jgi:hypothetical protein
VATIKGYISLPTNNYTALINAIQIGPISISVAASAWGLYTGGIFDSTACGYDINHAGTFLLSSNARLAFRCIHRQPNKDGPLFVSGCALPVVRHFMSFGMLPQQCCTANAQMPLPF